MMMIQFPTETDVLFGRGVATNRHPGNENFRSIIGQHVDVYVSSTKKQKMMISRSIVDRVRTTLDPPGRFLEKDASTGMYREVETKKALEKTAQTLRDLAAPLRKQLSEDFSDPSFLSAIFDGGGSGYDDDDAGIMGGGGGDGSNNSNNNGQPRGHRRMKTAPARDLVIPADQLLMPPLPKRLRSKPNSPVNLPDNFNVPAATTTSPLELSPARGSSSRATISTTTTTGSRSNRGHHRRHRTFGGYSCSDATDGAADFLTGEDLNAAIPPLFASQLPESARQTVGRALHPFSPSPNNNNANNNNNAPSAMAAAASGRRRHRRHNTVDSFSFSGGSYNDNNAAASCATAAPVFSDDPSLTFDSPGDRHGSLLHQPPNVVSSESRREDLGNNIGGDFSAFDLPQMLAVPELPEPRPTTHGGGRGRHRRMHTTGDLLGGGGSIISRGIADDDDDDDDDGGCFQQRHLSMPLEPVHEETNPPLPPSLESILSSIQPMAHEPRKTEHELRPSPTSMEGILSALGSISEDDAAAAVPAPRKKKHSRAASLPDTDFLNMMKSIEPDSDHVFTGDGGSIRANKKMPSPCESIDELTPLAMHPPNGSQGDNNGSFFHHGEHHDMNNNNSMGKDNQFLAFCGSGPADDGDVVFHDENNINVNGMQL